MSKPTEAVLEELKAAGASNDILVEACKSLEAHFPKKTYYLAVWFLEFATILLILGGVATLLLERGTSEALWATAGAGVGGLAGIFTGRGST